MRIIAGKFKGRKLYSPKDESIRPTADRVKEAIFSMLDEYLNGAVVLDLFSGSGSLGLEAISRGAKICYFCDSSAESIRLTKSNIDKCNAGSQSVLIAGDFIKALLKMPEKADIILLDPPYEKGFLDICLKKIYENGVLSEDGIIVAEHGAAEVLPDSLLTFNRIKKKKYGSALVSLYIELSGGVC